MFMQNMHVFTQIIKSKFSLYRFCHFYHILDEFLFPYFLYSHVHQCSSLSDDCNIQITVNYKTIKYKRI